MLRAFSLTTTYRCCRFSTCSPASNGKNHIKASATRVVISTDASDRKRALRREGGKLPTTRMRPVPVGPKVGDKHNPKDKQKQAVIRDPAPYPAPPIPSRRLPIEPVAYTPRSAHLAYITENILPVDDVRHDRQQLLIAYHLRLHRLATTQCPTEAWNAYSYLLSLPHVDGENGPKIPFPHLHRLCRLLSRSEVKNRVLFLRMLSLMYYIQRSGGVLHLFEWNALVDIAGKGIRRPAPQDFRLALDVYNDMVSGFAPGHSFSPDEYPRLPGQELFVQPDIVTYTTLLNHATKTLHGPALHQATRLLNSSGLSPNRITLLCLLAYHTATKSLSGVRSILERMRREGLELGLDGVNSCLWAFAHNLRLDVVHIIYRILRHSVEPEPNEDAITALIQKLEEDECVRIPLGMRPNEITYTAMIQCMAYHGDLATAIDVFFDMMKAQNREVGAALEVDGDGVWQPARYVETQAVYRAIFLGYARHGERVVGGEESLAARLQYRRPWNLDTLQDLFEMFMSLPDDTVAHKSMIYWTVVAFIKVSDGDVHLVRDVWRRLVEKFDGPWGGANNRLQRLHYALSQSDEEARNHLRTLNRFNNAESGWAYESGWR